MDKLAGFHGVVNSFEQYPRDWQLWYTSKEPETLPLIGRSNFIFKKCGEGKCRSMDYMKIGIKMGMSFTSQQSLPNGRMSRVSCWLQARPRTFHLARLLPVVHGAMGCDQSFHHLLQKSISNTILHLFEHMGSTFKDLVLLVNP